jgi:hypothetical protein
VATAEEVRGRWPVPDKQQPHRKQYSPVALGYAQKKIMQSIVFYLLNNQWNHIVR